MTKTKNESWNTTKNPADIKRLKKMLQTTYVNNHYNLDEMDKFFERYKQKAHSRLLTRETSGPNHFTDEFYHMFT